ncbi:MAG: GNAT family N-acetyltransferase [Xanthobacteraceae bacterium]|nr:MAG: GNAT family N-acetyltransferase [Xanthobacteraceae bacterium]
MTIVRVTMDQPANAAGCASSRIARVVVFDTLAAAEPHWRRLQCPPHSSTFYQRFEFLSAWQRHVGERRAFAPFIAVAFDAEGEPLMVLPLVSTRILGLRYAFFMGGKHSNFNMPLYRRYFAASATPADLADLIAALRRHVPRIDVLAFTQQPVSWHGIPNPLSLLPRQPSVNVYPRLTFPADGKPDAAISTSLRRRLKDKERKLQALPGYRHVVATGEADIQRMVDTFFRLKPAHMAAQKLPNVFAEPGVEEFVRDICRQRDADAGPLVVLHALECEDEVIALYAGMEDGQRYTMMFNTYTLSANARYSPGLILMRHIVDHYAARGFRMLDLGIGEADYKRMFCKEQDPVFDSFLPLTARGHIGAAALSALHRAKHMIKQSPRLLTVVSGLRRALRR